MRDTDEQRGAEFFTSAKIADIRIGVEGWQFNDLPMVREMILGLCDAVDELRARSRSSDSGTTPAESYSRVTRYGAWVHDIPAEPADPPRSQVNLSDEARAYIAANAPFPGTIERADDVEQVATDTGHIVSVVGSVSREQRGEK